MDKMIRYQDEFKQKAVNQVVAHGYPVLKVSKAVAVREEECR